MTDRAAVVAQVRRAKDWMDAHYAEPLDVGALAAVACCSRYHFSRSFAAAYGESPKAYLTRRRIERAQDLLRSANLTVTEVCLAVGFTSLGTFSRRFAEITGQTPSEYRARARSDGPPPVPGCYLMMWTRPAPGSAHSEKPPEPPGQ
ncbi:helix-turn-helix domain-containing protein [Amycolatopsis thermophila]|uniref:Transcriptional regulator GlxA family with amidase domain n=1 Tax=Amycolatopsis thermophila TaxID=206084 RepID=A0ABU0F2R7_9PSEU|nr:AraC family transcriptional regulator [Amycolatopsis thermophila]MDQ0381870.1 transcriptional regulator GlxA family with amidase domain [Amycolatopsis thermophila]